MYEIIAYFWLCVSVMGAIAMLLISLEHPALLAITMVACTFCTKTLRGID